MISAMLPPSIGINLLSPQQGSSGTDVKIKKLVLRILAAISFAIGTISLIVGTGAALLLAIPTLAIGGYLIWKISRFRDYEDPKQLEQFRKEAANQPLETTAEKHGWDKMFLYEIPRKGDFHRLYSASVKTMTFYGLIAYYERASKIREKYVIEGKTAPVEIPHPREFLGKFEAEVRGLTACEIFARFDLGKLRQYVNVSDSDLEGQKEYTAAWSAKMNDSLKVYQTADALYEKALTQFAEILQKTSGETQEEKDWIATLKKDATRLKRGSSSLTYDDLPIFRDSDLSEEMFSRRYAENKVVLLVNEERKKVIKELLDIKKERNFHMKKIEENFEKSCARINSKLGTLFPK